MQLKIEKGKTYNETLYHSLPIQYSVDVQFLALPSCFLYLQSLIPKTQVYLQDVKKLVRDRDIKFPHMLPVVE